MRLYSVRLVHKLGGGMRSQVPHVVATCTEEAVEVAIKFIKKKNKGQKKHYYEVMEVKELNFVDAVK